VLDLTRAWVARVLQHERDRDGNLALPPPARGAAPPDPAREFCLRQGFTGWRLEHETAQVREAHAAARRAAAGPQPPA
jgi:hypothetical protein